jgi:hypothetical protein
MFLCFALPDRRAVARVLRHEDALNFRRLRAILACPQYLLKPGIGSVLDRADVTELASAIAVLREICPGATDKALAESLPLKSPSHRPLDRWLAYWIGRAVLPKSIFAGDPTLVPITTVAEMKSVGLRMNNCLATRILPALSGEKQYSSAVVRGVEHVVEVTKIADVWHLTGVFAPRNADVTPEAEFEIRNLLSSVGVKPVADVGDDKWAVFRTALRNVAYTEVDDNHGFPPLWLD